ncbi:hypothetical protein ACP70R_005345 [Stipagrostis hirtigluma subsp. patula]
MIARSVAQMDGNRGVVCRLQCEISSVSVTGLGCGGGELFLRCHVPAGGGRAIQIDSRATVEPPDGQAPPGVVSWRDVASLSCDGSPACVRELVDRRSVVFEVRRRPAGGRSRAVLRRVMGSELVGRAEVPWRDAGGGVAAVERRVALAARGGGRRAAHGEATPPVLTVSMSVRMSEMAEPVVRRRFDSVAHREAGCEWSMGGEDVLALVAGATDDAFE